MKKLYPHRFELILFSQLAILFGALIFGARSYDHWINPALFILNFLASLILLSKKKKLRNFMGFLILFSTALLGSSFAPNMDADKLWMIRSLLSLVFYGVVTIEIITQVWSVKKISLNSLMGMVSGYISVGFVGYFFLSFIYILDINSFSNLGPEMGMSALEIKEQLMYYSYITLLTIGYGDIVPISNAAQKVSILIGLSGQIYLTVITAIVVGKFLNQYDQVEVEEEN
ncbi:MAG: ion channel [Flavobacteriaceae bacterium]